MLGPDLRGYVLEEIQKSAECAILIMGRSTDLQKAEKLTKNMTGGVLMHLSRVHLITLTSTGTRLNSISQWRMSANAIALLYRLPVSLSLNAHLLGSSGMTRAWNKNVMHL